MRYKILSNDLDAGMFVAELDRPWLGTPFWFQGFLIEEDEQLMQLRQYCNFVLVDSNSSLPSVQAKIAGYAEKKTDDLKNYEYDYDINYSDDVEDPIPSPSFIPEHIKLIRFRNSVPVEKELATAKVHFARSTKILEDMIIDLTNDKQLSIENVEVVIHDVVQSMVRNPDALMLITRMRQDDVSVFGHGLNVAIYLVALGRHLGLPREFLEQLCTTGLLLDVGKTKIPHGILQKQGRLSSDEFEIIKNHVQISANILKNTPKIHPDILQAVEQHHERENGSGYPDGLSKEDISLFGRMAAIVDTFSAMTRQRPYANSFTTYEALQTMLKVGSDLYHTPIVEQFIHAIGIFPVGSLVELSSGEVAIVISHNKSRRLKPQVLVVTENDKTPSKSHPILNLLKPPATYETPPHIVKGLPIGTYGINPRDYYLGQ
jgi:HD-GYP domain-containing protein (c-di-GMP phosphodiesterase class II)